MSRLTAIQFPRRSGAARLVSSAPSRASVGSKCWSDMVRLAQLRTVRTCCFHRRKHVGIADRSLLRSRTLFGPRRFVPFVGLSMTDDDVFRGHEPASRSPELGIASFGYGGTALAQPNAGAALFSLVGCGKRQFLFSRLYAPRAALFPLGVGSFFGLPNVGLRLNEHYRVFGFELFGRSRVNAPL